MDEAIAQLECYEPAGKSLDFSAEDLLGHTLAIGGSGAGKTTRLVHPLISKLIQSESPRLGLCILDSKDDGTMESIIRRACFDAGREDDLLVINGKGSNHLDLFSEINREGFEAIDWLTALIGSVIPRDERNKYWENTFEGLLRQTLRLIQLSENSEWNYHTLMQQLIRYLLLHQLRDTVFTDEVEQLKEKHAQFDPNIQLILDEVIATHKMWDTLDYRTRSILQSMTASITGPMNSQTAHRYFEGQSPVNIYSAVRNRKIILISIDGVRHPECARLVSCFSKGLFYDSILKSKAQQINEPKAGIILDDWPICASAGSGSRYSDVDALAMIRSRGGFIISATQSLAALDLAIGRPSRDAALANFANLIFFRGRDAEADAIAAAYLGTKTETLTDTSIYEGKSSSIRRSLPTRYLRQIQRPAVPQGAIARLATGDAYAIIGASVYNEAMSLVPLQQDRSFHHE